MLGRDCGNLAGPTPWSAPPGLANAHGRWKRLGVFACVLSQKRRQISATKRENQRLHRGALHSPRVTHMGAGAEISAQTMCPPNFVMSLHHKRPGTPPEYGPCHIGRCRKLSKYAHSFHFKSQSLRSILHNAHLCFVNVVCFADSNCYAA